MKKWEMKWAVEVVLLLNAQLLVLVVLDAVLSRARPGQQTPQALNLGD